MMIAETELKPSTIHGLGVFLMQPVRKGELIWRFDSRIDLIYTEEEIATLPVHVQRYLRTYTTWHEATGVYVLCGDNGRYFDHSDIPTTVSTPSPLAMTGPLATSPLAMNSPPITRPSVTAPARTETASNAML
jgi:SET domain-containing protein